MRRGSHYNTVSATAQSIATGTNQHRYRYFSSHMHTGAAATIGVWNYVYQRANLLQFRYLCHTAAESFHSTHRMRGKASIT